MIRDKLNHQIRISPGNWEFITQTHPEITELYHFVVQTIQAGHREMCAGQTDSFCYHREFVLADETFALKVFVRRNSFGPKPDEYTLNNVILVRLPTETVWR